MQARHGHAFWIARLRAPALYVSFILVVASSASAQTRDAQSWNTQSRGARTVVATSLAASGGSVTDQRGVRSNAATLAPAVSFSRAGRFDLTIGGALTRFQTGAQSVGVYTGLALSQRVSDWAKLSLNGAASTARTSFASRFESADVLPALELSAGRFTVFAGARGAIGASTFDVERTSAPTPPGLPLGSPRNPTAPQSTMTRERFVRRGLAPLAGAQATFTEALQSRTGVVSYRIESLRIDRLTLVDHQAAMSLSLPRATLGASVGRRLAADERRTFAAVTLSIVATRALSIDLGGGSYPTGRVSGTLGGTFLQAGATLRTGGTRSVAMASAPAPRGAPRPLPGMTRLAIHAPRAATVSVAGDWNEWQQEPATRGDNGVWYVDVPLPEGEYRYAFRVDGAWRVPAGVAQADDGFGGKAAFVTVRGERRAQDPPTQEHQ